MNLEGKVCLVTGASGGIGEALGYELTAARANVVLFARRADRLAAIVGKIGSDRALAVAGDIGSADDIGRAVRAAVNRFGGLDVLINNAGVAVMNRLADVPESLVERAFRTNVFGPILAIQAALPSILERGGGMIVNVSSAMSLHPSPTMAVYSATKAALNVISASLREELKDKHVRVMTVHPGYLANEFGLNTLSADDELVASRRSASATRSNRTSEDAARDIVRAMREDAEVFRSNLSAPLIAPL